MLYRGAVAVVFGAWTVSACGGVSSDPGDDVGEPDVDATEHGGGPESTECVVPWTGPGGDTAACAGRRVTTIEGLADSMALSATPTPTGDLALAYNAKVGGGGALVVLNLDATLGTWTEANRFTGGAFDNIGTEMSLVASGEVMHMVYLARMSDGDELRYRILIPGAEPIPTRFGDFSAMGHVALSFDGAGDLIAAHADPARTQSHVWRSDDGNWHGPTEVDGNGAAVISAGVVDVAADPQGNLALAYHHRTSPTTSELRMRRWRGTEWTAATAVHGAGGVQRCGASVSIAFVGATPVMAYFDDGGEASAGSSLRVALAGDAAPTVTTLASDLGQPVGGRWLALAADAQGTLYLAVLARRADVGQLELWTQPPGGKWNREVIDDHAADADDWRFAVDLVIDGAGLPHVLYYSGTRGELRWATRDRGR